MSLKKAYLYLVSTISLVIAVIGAIMLINLALKAWVFTKADKITIPRLAPFLHRPTENQPVATPATRAA